MNENTEIKQRDCPFCKESIVADAVKCKHCGSSITPESPSHGGTCPYCKEKIHPEAIKCRHCKSSFIENLLGDCGCSMPQESTLRQLTGLSLPTTKNDLNQMTTAGLKRARRMGNHIIVGGPLDPGNPLPCEGGYYDCYFVWIPIIGLILVCVWKCETF